MLTLIFWLMATSRFAFRWSLPHDLPLLQPPQISAVCPQCEGIDTGQKYTPTPDEIAAECAKIRAERLKEIQASNSKQLRRRPMMKD